MVLPATMDLAGALVNADLLAFIKALALSGQP
jgi:hypothetical protein